MRGRRKRNVEIAVATVESDVCSLFAYEVPDGGEPRDPRSEKHFNVGAPAEESGKNLALFDRIATKYKQMFGDGEQLPPLVLSMPGNIGGHSRVIFSSRLGILEEVDARSYLQERIGARVAVVHDMECMILGATQGTGAVDQAVDRLTCYLLVDEGVGCSFMLNGRMFKGAGRAGCLSRLVVDGQGQYSSKLGAAGILEAYVSRPSISERCVEQIEQHLRYGGESGGNDFRLHLKGLLDQNERTRLSFEQLKEGIEAKDIIAKSCVECAEDHLSRVLHSMIMMLNPHEIILFGGFFSKIPNSYEDVVSKVRGMTFPASWKTVSFSRSRSARRDQRLGAVIYGLSNLLEES